MTIPDIARPMTALPDAWIGVNFWSRVGGPFMWRSFDETVVREELQTLADHSLTVTRSFFFWPDFHPEPYEIDEELCRAFARFLDLHSETGLTTIPTFIVGHMSGQNWDPAWRNGRDLYTDVWMVGRQAWFIQQMTERFAEHPAVAGWLISNEMPLYGGGGGLMGPVERVDGAAVRTWSELMVAAVRAAGATQPVSLGDGAWGLEVMGQDNGFRLSWSAPLTDWIGPHSYHMNDDPVRQNLIPAFNAELCAPHGKPVVMEEFGVTSEFAADDNAADYYRQVLHSTLAAGVTGWLGWNNTDFDLDAQEPYNHRPFELHFGLTTADGTPKPALRELGAFARAVRDRGLAHATRASTRTGLVVSSYFDGGFPFWGPEESPALRDALLEGYIAARLADLAPAIVRDDADVPALPLLVVPSAKAITTPGARALADAARAGSTVWVSFSCGETLNQRGWWWPGVDQTFGVRHAARYGLAEPVTGDTVVLHFEEAFGDLAAGEQLVLPVGGPDIARAVLPVEATEARVVARDAEGRPALLVHETGAGRLVLCTYPVELFAARTGFVDRSSIVRLYRALAEIADAAGPVQVSAPDVYGDLVHGPDGEPSIVLISEAGERREVTVRMAGRADLETSLAPFDAAIIAMAPLDSTS
ncbi:cellulase family glycosylhydrolase [Microbacterium sp. NPDC097977]|uniref:glycoside hydrolase 5 family protein n=1 Tax=Microbacterium sp. NPDC097977 TaxID=3155686 RepID=UPI003322E778